MLFFTSLVLTKFKLTFGEIKYIKENLRNNKIIYGLDLSGNNLNKIKTTNISDALKSNSILIKIDLTECCLGDKEVRYFSEII